MEEIDYGTLIKTIKNSGKKSYETYEDDGKMKQNVANLGAKIGDVAKLERSGEYYGIAVEFIENLKPLLTFRFVINILKMLKDEDYMTPLSLLGLSSLDELQYILHTWFQSATSDYHDEFVGSNKNYPQFDKWIHSVTHDPILGKIKIVEIGQNKNTGDPVVPPEWIDMEFDDGYQLHKKMDTLENRIGKPPVTFAIIYSMIIQKHDTLVKDVKNIKYDYIFYLDLLDNKINSNITKKIRKGYDYVKYHKILIGFKLKDILEPKSSQKSADDSDKPKEKISTKEVGLLVSRLQKCIRRGKYASRCLTETVASLNISPNYNLPEHGFMRVSSSKQLVWRLFISILEDCRAYQPIDELSLLDLILLTLITQRCQEYKFTKQVMRLIKLTALLAQYNDKKEDWYDFRKYPEAKSTPIIYSKKSEETEDDVNDIVLQDYHNSLSLALTNIIMMAGDKKMLSKLYSIETILEPFIVPEKYLHKDEVYEDVVLSSYDQHCKPHIILYYQACIPISITTKQIPKYIWDVSSSYNVRYGKDHPPIDETLRSIQNYFYKNELKGNTKDNNNAKIKNIKYDIKEVIPDGITKRCSFLILFGRKYRYKGNDVILSGGKRYPAKIKINNEWVSAPHEGLYDLLNAYPKKYINLSEIDPPFGFKWTEKKVFTEMIEGKPIIKGNPIPYFDGSSLLESVIPKITNKVDKNTYKLIIKVLSGTDIEFKTLIMFRKKYLDEIMNWLPSSKDIAKLDTMLIKLAYTKIFNQINNIIMIGPVDRSGGKVANSINYLLEGKLWSVFNLFTYLYRDTFKPMGTLNFKINKGSSGYIHLIQTIEKILFDHKIIEGTVPIIKTKLWDHQQESVNKIVSGFDKGYHGFGDASDVGSGKTLTSLKIAARLIESNDVTYSGILVMLPGNKLIDTWKEEIKKHTKGFDVIYQEHSAEIGLIKRNTIVITTMSRMRDNPINHKWLLLIIDECLTVQNKNALWTEQAWIQSMMSKHLIMMSATFFRTRFDKLYYMLKMLNTNLPEKRDYLETILLESIISQVSQIKRKWVSNINYIELGKKLRSEYNDIDKSSLNIDVKFSKLTSFLIKNEAVNSLIVTELGKMIESAESKKRKCLIYARASEEALFWSDRLNIPIYPEKGKHCIVTYHDGTYGLNDLVIYDTIIMRPPAPDKLPQIKGRLDRPGQTKNNLFIEYFIVKNTIEEGLILRMNIASQFLQKYIMPLAKFYDISVNYQKYLDEKSE